MLAISEFFSQQIFFFLRLAKEGRKIGELERKTFENYSTLDGIRYFEYLSWVSPCWEQMVAIGAQAMYIACNDTCTSVIAINFRKSETHTITDTYCIRFGSGRTGSKIVSNFRLTCNRKLRLANRNTIIQTIAQRHFSSRRRSRSVSQRGVHCQTVQVRGTLYGRRSLVIPWRTSLARPCIWPCICRSNLSLKLHSQPCSTDHDRSFSLSVSDFG